MPEWEAVGQCPEPISRMRTCCFSSAGNARISRVDGRWDKLMGSAEMRSAIYCSVLAEFRLFESSLFGNGYLSVISYLEIDFGLAACRYAQVAFLGSSWGFSWIFLGVELRGSWSSQMLHRGLELRSHTRRRNEDRWAVFLYAVTQRHKWARPILQQVSSVPDM